MDYKPKIMQHFVEVYTNNGGPATGYALLMNSFLADKYHFIPLIQKKSLSGINLSLLNDLVKQIKKEKPDIVHIRGLLSEGFYGMLAARLAGCKKVVLSVHGMSIDTIEISPIKKFIYNKFIDPFTLRNADLVYCVCEYATKRPYINKYTNHLYGFIYNVAPEYSKYDSVIAKKKYEKN